MRGDTSAAADAFLLAAPVTAVPGKSFVVTSVIVNVTVAGTVIVDDGPSAGAINLGSFPVGRAQIRFPGGILVTDSGSAPTVLGTGTKTVSFGGYTIPGGSAGGATQTGPPESTATVTLLSPSSVQAGGMVSVIIDGSGFTPDSQIEVVGKGPGPNATSYISPTQVQTNYLFPSAPGVYQVGVRNPGEQLSNTLPFTVT